MNSQQLAYNIKRDCLDMAHSRKIHIGGCLSMSDILAVLYSDILKYDVNQPMMDDRDRLIISKGHSSTALYSVLTQLGFITREEYMTQYENGSHISGHVSHKVPGIEVSTGSLGHGFSIACGMALAAKKDNKNHHIYVILGDGEAQEGTIWEASLFAIHNKLDNLTVIIDHNKVQSEKSVKDTLGIDNFAVYLKNFGFNLSEVDGHNHEELKKAFDTHVDGKPKCIVAHTVKGKGVSFMEYNPKYHTNSINDEQYNQAIKELEAYYEK